MGNEHDIAFNIDIKGGTSSSFRVISFSCVESLSQLFHLDINIACHADRSIKPAEMIDNVVDFSIHHQYKQLQADGVYNNAGIPVPERYFNGVIESIEHLSTDDKWSIFQISVMPTLHRLRYSSDCRIFQNKSIKEIVTELFGERGIVDFNFSLRDPHIAREFCVQYNETHLAFIQRLLAEEGIFFYFRHEKGKHQLILTDLTQGSVPLNPSPLVEFHDASGGVIKGQYISQFGWRETLRSNEYIQRDYCFKAPNYNQEHKEKLSITPDGIKAPDYEKYHYHARYKTPTQGIPFTRYRIESERADASQGEGNSNLPHFSAGRRFILKEHTIDSNNREYLLVSVSHSGTQPQALDNKAGEGATTYDNRFTVVADIATPSWRPPMMPKPVIHGSQMAYVVGPSGEEIYTDQYGRVKLHFPWDRYSEKNDNSSCWVRVSQVWAGRRTGMLSIPRIGDEVIVDFLEGDPDQPIVIGRTYNALNLPPIDLPAGKTQTGIISRTSKGGKAQNANQMKFEDAKGKEHVTIQAEKDQTNIVKHNEVTTVGNNRTETVTNNETITINNDRTETVVNNETLTIQGDRSKTVNKNETNTIKLNRNTTITDGNESLTVAKGDETHAVTTGKRTTTIKGDDDLTLQAGNKITTVTAGDESINIVAGSRIITVKTDENRTITGDSLKDTKGVDSRNVTKEYSVTSDKEIQFTVGADVGIVMNKTEIILRVSGNTIKIDKSIIALNGTEIKLN